MFAVFTEEETARSGEEEPLRSGEIKSLRSQDQGQSLRRSQPVRIQESLRGEENVGASRNNKPASIRFPRA